MTSDEAKQALKKINEINEITKIQCSDGNWNYDPYMHGMANGLILAKAILNGKEPVFLDPPREWLVNKKRRLWVKFFNKITMFGVAYTLIIYFIISIFVSLVKTAAPNTCGTEYVIDRYVLGDLFCDRKVREGL